MSRLCYEHEVHPSVRLSVTLMDCNHTVQHKVEIGIGSNDIIGRCLRYLHAETNPDCSIL